MEKSKEVTIEKETSVKSEVVTMRQLLECGVHFGHQTKRWNPKMKKYIFTARNGIHVIDLQQSLKLIKTAHEFVSNIVKKNGTIMFVGTKKLAQESIFTEAKRCGMPYVHHRWLGGTLTNNITIRRSINKLKRLESMVEDGTIDKLSNKEASQIRKKITRLNYYLAGIKNMIAIPSALFVVDTKKEQLAIKEAHKLGIPIIGVVDTNADPTEVQYPIPANDDAIRAIKLLCGIISNAVSENKPTGTESTSNIEALEKEMTQEKAGAKTPVKNAAKAATSEKTNVKSEADTKS